MTRILRHPLLWLAATLGWAGVVWFFSSLPGGSAPGINLPHADKVLHFICFSGGGFLVAGFLLSLSGSAPDWRKIIKWSVLVIALLGWLDEWHQCHIPMRSGADPWDWLADLLGGITGAGAVRLIFGCWLVEKKPKVETDVPGEISRIESSGKIERLDAD